MKKLTLLIFLLSINVTFCQEKWTNFENATYAIEYPESWTFDDSGQMQTTFFINSPLTEDDTFKENINLIIQNLKGQNINMKDYVELTQKQTKGMLDDGKILESNGDDKQHVMVLTGKVSGNALKFKQVLIFHQEVMYILTFSALEKSYDDYIKTGNTILNSFKLK
ncbi:hypothetical protein [uncultured Psychroserpens sp.]|uniref:hypothetical protein n=1 Tax=uncultured Psychroserpens sp. TaxID=255436 RepID=UPI002610E3B0|nr:hypothetical protein [uncultured Psychroserpens sp.]